MNRSDFETMQRLLRDHGFVIGETQYSRESFGSWWVGVTTVPRQRVLWDGKDGWLIVQEETNERFQDSFMWRDVWVAKESTGQSCEAALEQLRRRTGAA